MATANELKQRQADIELKIDALRYKLDAERMEITRENERKLRELSDSVGERIKQHDRRTAEEYRAVLGRFTSQKQKEIEDEINTLRREYTELDTKIQQQLSEEQQRYEQLLVSQRRFEEAYNHRRDTAKARAEEVKSRFDKRFYDVVRDVPLEWFMPGHIDIYRRRLSDADGLMTAGLYESVIGICDNMQMQLEFDVLETEDRFAKWLHYLTMLRQIGSDEERIFTEVHTIPQDMPLLARLNRLIDGRMSDELLDRYSDGGYTELHREYDETMLSGITQIPDEVRQIRAFMRDNPQLSEKINDIYLYDRIRTAIGRQDRIQDVFGMMYSRMRSWEERLSLFRQVKDILSADGYKCSITAHGENHIVSFTDDMDVHHFELMLIPVLRRMDNRWIDLAVCYIPQGIDRDRYDRIRTMLAQVLVTQGIDIEYRKTDEDTDTDARVREASVDKYLQVNGRLN